MGTPRFSFFYLLAIIYLLPCIDQGPLGTLQSYPSVVPPDHGRIRPLNRGSRQHLIALYDGFDPLIHDRGIWEIFAAGLGNPRESIKCWGFFVDAFTDEEARDNLQPHFLDIRMHIAHIGAQHICAKPQYGGLQQLHIGGWCRRGTGDPQVVFDPTQDARPNRQLDSLETKRWCQQQCYCNDPLNPSNRPPKIKNYRAQNHPRDDTYILSGHLMSFPPPRLPPKGTSGLMGISVAIVNQKQAVDPANPQVSTTQYLGLAASRMIYCPGKDLPTWLPPPWEPSDFPTIQSFCSAVFNGGNVNANIGGVCVESLHPDVGSSPYLQFSRALMPDPSFKRVQGSPIYHHPDAFQYWCFAKCTCTKLSENSPILSRDHVVIKRGPKTFKIDTSQGGVVVTIDREGQHSVIFNMIPKQGDSDGGEGDERCSAETSEFCTNDPSMPYMSAFSEYPDILPSVPGTCGQPCRGDGECYNPGDFHPKEQCQCRVVEIPPPGVAVFDPASPLAFCLTASAMLLLVKEHSRLLDSTLIGRSIEDRDVEDRSVDDTVIINNKINNTVIQEPKWGCLCNTTYASRSCCDSTTKTVHEDPESRLSFHLLAAEDETEVERYRKEERPF